MKYYVIELQTNADGTSGNIVTAYADHDTAEAAFLTKKIAALQSSVLVHTIVWLDNKGKLIDSKAYIHPVVETEETEEQ